MTSTLPVTNWAALACPTAIPCVWLIGFANQRLYLWMTLIVQVSDKERQLELDSLFKDVASVLSEKCINPDNNKPYTISMLERALKDVHFSVDLHRNAKQQALEVSKHSLRDAIR